MKSSESPRSKQNAQNSFESWDAVLNSPPPSTAHRQNRYFHASGKWHRRASPAPPQSHSHWTRSGHIITWLAAEGRSDRGFSPNRCREVFRRQPKSVLHELVSTRDQASNDPRSKPQRSPFLPLAFIYSAECSYHSTIVRSSRKNSSTSR